MKWTKFFIVLAAFIGTAFLIDRLYAPIPTWADHMSGLYAKQKDSIGIILIGNSHTGAIRDTRIGQYPVMNLSIAGIEMQERRTLLEEVTRNKGSLKYVLMSMDYDQLGHQTTDSHVGNMLLPYALEQDKSTFAFLKKFNANNFMRHNRDFSVLKKYYSDGIDFTKELNFIPVGFRDKTDMKACAKRAVEMARLNFREERMNDNIEIVKEIKAMLDARGITLVMLNTPKTACLTKEYHAQFKQENRERLLGFLQANNIPFLNFEGSNHFNDSDFVDFDHLNTQGSAKLSALIATQLDASNSVTRK